jgi:hypothetical protein
MGVLSFVIAKALKLTPGISLWCISSRMARSVSVMRIGRVLDRRSFFGAGAGDFNIGLS